VRQGKFTGWDDVRAPTLAAYRRRGFQPEALRAFWVSMGLSEKDVAASMENLEAENRRFVEPTSNRFFFVPDPVTVAVSGLPQEGLVGHAPYHPDDPARGVRKVKVGGPDGPSTVLLPADDVAALAPGDVFRLKDWGNLRWAGDGKASFEGDDVSVTKQGVPILQWCSGRMRQALEARLLMPDGAVVAGVVEPAAAKDVGKVVQFERVGFARIESADGLITACFAHE
jgi:glutamyl-tRNA synthetase